jgi:type I restriction enzyme S subunit
MVINDISVQGTRKRVSLGDFKDVKFVMPPLNDQADIADYTYDQCVKIDALIDKSEGVVDLIKERRTALISAAVTGKIDVRDWQAT